MEVGEVPAVAAHAARFEDFYDHERAGLLALVHALCRSSQPAVAEDIVQDSFVRAFEHWAKIVAYDRPDLWLRRVAINLATSRYRRLRTEVHLLSRIAANGSHAFELPGDITLVLVALKRLPRRQAQVLALRYVDEMSTEEIVEVLGIAPGTVRTHLRRGHDALRRDPRFTASIRESSQ